VNTTLNLNISAPRQNFKNLIKTKNLDKELLYPDALIIFFLTSKIREKTAKSKISGHRQKLKNLVSQVVGNKFLNRTYQFFLSKYL